MLERILQSGGYHRLLNRAISFLSEWGMRDMGLLKELECNVLPDEGGRMRWQAR